MESVWLLHFALMGISIVGFVLVKHSAIIKRSTLTPIKVLNLFSNLHMIFGRWRGSVQLPDSRGLHLGHCQQSNKTKKKHTHKLFCTFYLNKL